MSFSRVLLQVHGLGLKSNEEGDGRSTQTQTRTRTRLQVVCCCPHNHSHGHSKVVKKVVEKQGRLPPGPSLLHLIGVSLSHYLIRSLPVHYALADLAKTYGPLLHFQIGQLPLIVVSSPKMAKAVLKTHDVACAYRPKTTVAQLISYDYSDVVTSPYGSYWKQLRHICVAELLSAKNVRSFEYIRKDEGSILIDRINSISPAPFNLTDEIFWFMNSTTCRAVFGNVSMDRASTISSIRRAMALAGNMELADLFPSIKLLNRFTWKAHELVKLKSEMDKILDLLIDQHRQNLAVTGKGYGELGTENFVDVLIRLKESDDLQFPMTDDSIKAVICDMFAGGTESASSAVDWTMTELVRNPHVMEKVQAEIRQQGRKTIEESEIRNLKYLKLVVKESMRLHPPNALIPRSCGEEGVEIDGYHIPQNATIVINVWMLGRDPSYWRKPESFEPERFEGNPVDFLGNNFEFIPFGAGKRICPAIAFAVTNVEFVLAQLLFYFDWKLPPGMRAADLDMTEAVGFSSSRKATLQLVATPYAPAFAQ